MAIQEINDLENSDNLLVFTDGSYLKGVGSGASVVIMTNKRLQKYTSITVPKECGIYEAEAFAVLSATKLLLGEKCFHSWKKVYLLIDSKAVIQSIDNDRHRDKVVHDIQSNIRLLANIYTSGVYISWCPGHKNISGNEYADFFAKVAVNISRHISSSTSDCPQPKRFTTQKIARWLSREWDSQWNVQVKSLGKTLQSAFPTRGSSEAIRQYFLRVPNYELAQLITAHCQLNQYLQRNDPLCPACLVPEDSFHYVFDCQRYENQRQRLRQCCGSKWDLRQFRCFTQDEQRLRALVEFIRETGRLRLDKSKQSK